MEVETEISAVGQIFNYYWGKENQQCIQCIPGIVQDIT